MHVQMSKPKIQDIFVCARCGSCCHGETTVSLDKDDQARMIRALGLERDEVAEKYWRITGSTVQMKTIDGHCIFYDKETGCTVHNGRPWRCGQWPLHPSILADRVNFETIRSSCPGMNQELSYDEFCALLKQLVEDSARLIV